MSHEKIDVQAVVFDAFGTLFDTAAVLSACRDHFGASGDSICAAWRHKQLEYTWLRSLMGRYEDFHQVTGAALIHACNLNGVACDEATRAHLMDEYMRLSPFEDVSDSLAALSGFKRAILSNGTPEMLSSLVESAGFQDVFDDVISVDPLRLYKPDPGVYELAPNRLGVPKDNICFVSSNAFDVNGAKSFGFRVCWVNRAGGPLDPMGYQPDWMVGRLSQLAEILAS